MWVVNVWQLFVFDYSLIVFQQLRPILLHILNLKHFPICNGIFFRLHVVTSSSFSSIFPLSINSNRSFGLHGKSIDSKNPYHFQNVFAYTILHLRINVFKRILLIIIYGFSKNIYAKRYITLARKTWRM